MFESNLYPNPAFSEFKIMLNGEYNDPDSLLEILIKFGQAIMPRKVGAGNASQRIEQQIPDAWFNRLYFLSVKVGHVNVVRPL